LEHAPHGVSETRDEVVEHELWVMGGCSRVTLFSDKTYVSNSNTPEREDGMRTHKDFFREFN